MPIHRAKIYCGAILNLTLTTYVQRVLSHSLEYLHTAA